MTTKIPAELSSTPGIVDNSNATAITIDSSENVAIGASSTSTKVTIQAADSDTVNSSSNGHLTFYDDAPFGYYKIRIATTNRDLAFDGYDTDNAWKEILKLDRVDQRINAKGGIMFGSDTAAVNTLDDYEEGTWTPQITASAGSAGTAAYSNQIGRYTKIGNKVFFEFSVVMTNKGSWSAYTRVLGFPFTANSTGLSPFAVSRFPDDTIGANMIAGELQPNTTYSFFTTGSRLDSLHDISNVDTGYYLVGAGHYTI